MDKQILELLNQQVVAELHAAYKYLAMRAHLEAEDWHGFAHWMRIQSEEEVEHAMRIYNFILDRDERVSLGSIDEPPSDFQSVLDVFRKALEHEQKVTQMINRIYQLAVEKDDYPTQVMLQWFIEEQVEEEKITKEAVAQLERAGDSVAGLVVLDREFGERSPQEGGGGE